MGTKRTKPAPTVQWSYGEGPVSGHKPVYIQGVRRQGQAVIPCQICIVMIHIWPGPRGARGRRPRDSQGLEGIISSPIMHWRAFFISFHHFYTEKQVIS